MDAVKQLGPMWANTCYEFESMNGDLKKMFHGTKKIDIQVSLSELRLGSIPFCFMLHRLEKQ